MSCKYYGCTGLTSISIGESVELISNELLSGCTSINDVYCYIDPVPSTAASAFKDSSFGSATLHVPANALADYKNVAPWSGFGNIVALGGSEEMPTVKKCATPIIAYNKGKLYFSCETDGALCVSNITDTDIKMHNGSEVDLSVTYNISVYAAAMGYENSDVATAMLCWIDCNPRTEGIANSVAQVEARPMLIQSRNGVLTITSEGNTEATPIAVYNTAGQMVGSTSMADGTATVNTRMRDGEVAIVKIGDRSVKVLVK